MAKKRKNSASTTGLTRPKGFKAVGSTCGIKRSGKPDLAIIVADGLCSAAGVFTRNKVPGAPVIVSKHHVRNGLARAIVCNSGVSNVATGDQGKANAKAMCQQVAKAIGCSPGDVLVCSTGVIGPQLPMDKILPGIDDAVTKLRSGPKADAETAYAILTTDLTAKTASKTIQIGKKTVQLGGIAKGSGMIAPNMATMLSFITTDVAIAPPLLRKALKYAADHSFNRISIDEDTSTSDSVLVLASAQAGNRTIIKEGAGYFSFRDALTDIAKDLAYKIVADGEGATKVFHVHVRGAKTVRDADRVGKTLVGSPLVKTAVHGGDPNWGRLVMAVGRSGAAVRPGRLSIQIGGVPVLARGAPSELTAKATRKLAAAMGQKDVIFTIDLGLGDGEAQWLGCDLSREYIRINADYTT